MIQGVIYYIIVDWRGKSEVFVCLSTYKAKKLSTDLCLTQYLLKEGKRDNITFLSFRDKCFPELLKSKPYIYDSF